MIPFHSSALVDSLLALKASPEYIKGYDMTKSSFVRYIQDEEGSQDIKIWEIAANRYDHFFLWSFSLPRSNFKTSPDGRVALAGEFVAGDDWFNCTRDSISGLINGQKAITEKQFYEGRAYVDVLEDSEEMMAWHLRVHERFNAVVGLQVEIGKNSNLM